MTKENWTARYFQPHEFDQPGLPGSGMKHMDRGFVALLDALRQRLGVPVKVNSGYRSPAYNSKLSSSGPKGPHTTGKASDIRAIDGKLKYRIVKEALELGFSGIGIGKTYIHLDTLGARDGYSVRPNIWTY